ncbi:MAG: MarR family transcriptional regulator [Burkholderiaceae bacterium]|nr:MarR family transcriptional regulator [Burkholderiaceae bacterium]
MARKIAESTNGQIHHNGAGHEMPIVDLETRVTEEDHTSLKLWLRMLACTTRIENEIRTRLREQFDVTLPRFDLMAQLQRHPEGLRMGELSKRMMVTGGNITGITDQLEQEKLVMRVSSPEDRRVYSVKLTAAGKRAFAKMAAAHEAWIDDLMSGLSQQEKAKLIQLLSQMKHHLTEIDTKE